MKYKNLSDQDQIVPNVGIAKANSEFDSSVKLENPNFQLVSQAPQDVSPSVGGAGGVGGVK